MSMRDLASHVSSKVTPQSSPIPGREAEMKPNHAGGYTFVVDDWTRLDRFLILGTEGNTYYATEAKQTKEAAASILRCLAADGPRTVRRIVEVSDGGKAPKNDPAILALAAAMKKGDDATRKLAHEAVPKVCRIGTHLFHLAEAVEAFGGWGRGTRRAFSSWYTDQDARGLAYQAVKYQSRDKWSHRDLLRLSKPRPARGSDTDRVLHWIAKGWPGIGDQPPEPTDPVRLIWAFERAKLSSSANETAQLVRDYNLPRECVKTEHLDSAAVWDALLHAGAHGMPLTALLRNLGKMASIGYLAPMSAAARTVCDRLGDTDGLRHARVHPLALLVAQRVYRQGHGVKGGNTWSAVSQVVDALDGAFYKAFDNVETTGKRFYLGLDVSGSMDSGNIAGLPGVTPRVAAGAMAMVTAAREPNTYAVGFTAPVGGRGYGGMHGGGETTLTPLQLSARRQLDDVCRDMAALPLGGTDCSLPMRDALAKKIPVDCFVVYTDSETWAGPIQPVQALKQYRDTMGIPAKLVVVGMTVTDFTIADPKDAGMIDVVGFDPAAPAVMSAFAAS
jgi:60 kDa SS-A/Ro ribonucleoprotein